MIEKRNKLYMKLRRVLPKRTAYKLTVLIIK